MVVAILHYLVATNLLDRTLCAIEIYYKFKMYFLVWKGELIAIMNWLVQMECS